MLVRFTAKAARELARLGPPAKLIVAKIEQYAANPASSANNVKALHGREEFRLRVGDYRVLFTVSDEGVVTVMLVVAIRHRSKAYD